MAAVHIVSTHRTESEDHKMKRWIFEVQQAENGYVLKCGQGARTYIAADIGQLTEQITADMVKQELVAPAKTSDGDDVDMLPAEVEALIHERVESKRKYMDRMAAEYARAKKAPTRLGE